MIEMGATAGLEFRECRMINFYRSRWPPLNWLKMPAALRDSMIVVYVARKTAG
jgi:hypothetical protein